MSDLSSLTDKQLLRRYVDTRCEGAFGELVLRHAPLVFAVCRRYLPREDAEDAFQATFLVLVRRADSTRWSKSIGPWLYTVARRVSMNARRELLAKRETELDDHPASLADIELLELREQFDRALSGLSSRYRDPLVLFYLQGKTRKEIAESLNVSVGTVRTRLQRGRQKLRLQLALRGVALVSAATAIEQTAVAEVPPALLTSTCNLATSAPQGAAAEYATKELQLMTKMSLATKAGLALAASATLALMGVPAMMTAAAKPMNDVIQLAQVTAEPGETPGFGVTGDDDKISENTFDTTGTPVRPPSIRPEETADDFAMDELMMGGSMGPPPNQQAAARREWMPSSFSPREARIMNALQQEITFDYPGMSLQEVADDLTYRHDVPIVIDGRGLEDIGVASDVPVPPISIRGVPLESALDIMLRHFDLTYVLADDVLTVTSASRAARWDQVHSYDLINLDRSSRLLLTSANELLDADILSESSGNKVIVGAPFAGHRTFMRLMESLAVKPGTPQQPKEEASTNVTELQQQLQAVMKERDELRRGAEELRVLNLSMWNELQRLKAPLSEQSTEPSNAPDTRADPFGN